MKTIHTSLRAQFDPCDVSGITEVMLLNRMLYVYFNRNFMMK
jgi:hypothetical protein